MSPRAPHALAAGVALVWLASCSDAAARAEATATPWNDRLEVRESAPFPRWIPGSPSTLVGSPPERIVAASVLSAEVLLAIAPDRTAAVHRFAANPVYSPIAEAAQAFGRFTSGDPEQIVSLDGDLVITDAFTHASTQERLEADGVTVVRTGPARSFEEVRENLRLIGYAVGEDAGAEELVRHMDRVLETTRRAVEDRASLRVMNLSPDLYCHGQGSLMDAVIRHVGAQNVAAAQGIGPYGLVSEEQVLEWAPDALILAAELTAESTERQRLLGHPTLSQLECVREGRLVFLSPALLGSTSHRSADATTQLAAALAPWR